MYPVKSGDTAEMLALHYCFTPMITTMVRADVLRKTGPFELPGPISDYMKWIEVAHLSGTHYDPEPLGCWRRHPRSTSKQANKVKSYAKTRAALKRGAAQVSRLWPRGSVSVSSTATRGRTS